MQHSNKELMSRRSLRAVLRRSPYVLGAIASLWVALALPAQSQYFEILSGTGVISRRGRAIQAGPGTRMIEGDRLGATKIRFLGDYGAFVAELRGFAEMTLVRRDRRGCVQNQISFVRWISFTKRPLTCKDSYILVYNEISGGSYRLTGTVTTLQTIDKTTVMSVREGSVESQSQGVTVVVPAGYGNAIAEGKPPTQPVKIDTTFKIENLKVTKTPLGAIVEGKVNPLNAVRIQGGAVALKEGGLFKKLIHFPILGNSIEIELENPEESRAYRFLPIPSRK